MKNKKKSKKTKKTDLTLNKEKATFLAIVFTVLLTFGAIISSFIYSMTAISPKEAEEIIFGQVSAPEFAPSVPPAKNPPPNY